MTTPFTAPGAFIKSTLRFSIHQRRLPLFHFHPTLAHLFFFFFLLVRTNSRNGGAKFAISSLSSMGAKITTTNLPSLLAASSSSGIGLYRPAVERTSYYQFINLACWLDASIAQWITSRNIMIVGYLGRSGGKTVSNATRWWNLIELIVGLLGRVRFSPQLWFVVT